MTQQEIEKFIKEQDDLNVRKSVVILNNTRAINNITDNLLKTLGQTTICYVFLTATLFVLYFVHIFIQH